MLAGALLALTFELDPGAVYQHVQQPLGATAWDVEGQGLLTAE